MPLFDFSCVCGKTKKDELVSKESSVVVCDCGLDMKKEFSDRFSFSWSNTKSLPPTASSKFSDHMRTKNFKKRLDAFDKMNAPVPNGVEKGKRYFGMEDDGIVGKREYKAPTMKDYDLIEKKVKEKKAQPIISA